MSPELRVVIRDTQKGDAKLRHSDSASKDETKGRGYVVANPA